MNHSPTIQRPQLVRYARFRWDEVRNQHQIVYPEGVLVLNESGASIIELCDGRSTVEIITALNDKVSGDVDLTDDVYGFINRLVEKGLLCDATD